MPTKSKFASPLPEAFGGLHRDHQYPSCTVSTRSKFSCHPIAMRTVDHFSSLDVFNVRNRCQQMPALRIPPCTFVPPPPPVLPFSRKVEPSSSKLFGSYTMAVSPAESKLYSVTLSTLPATVLINPAHIASCLLAQSEIAERLLYHSVGSGRQASLSSQV